MTFRKSKFWSLLLAHLFFLAALGIHPVVMPPTADAATQSILPYPRFKAFVTGTSDPLAGGKLYTYLPGTTTPTNTYTTSAGTVANANPVVLDANGEADVWFTGTIKLVLTDSDNVTVWTKDNVGAVGSYGSLTGDSTGNISGFDNATFTGRVTTATLTVTGTPTFTDNTINGADLIDNTVTKGKLNYTPGGYALHFGSTSFNPADGATYYFGFITGQPLTTIPAIRRIYIPKSGTIKSANVVGWNNAEVGTTEAWPMYIVIDNTTSVLIQSVSDNNVPRVWDNTAINIDVTAGSYFEIKTICPTWSTNPLEYNIGGNIYIE